MDVVDPASSNDLIEIETDHVDDDYIFPFHDVQFVSSSLNLAESMPATVSAVLIHLQSHMPKIQNPKFLDLGCGDGRLVFKAAQDGLFAVGIDLEPTNIAVCQESARKLGLSDRCLFLVADIFTFDLSPFNLISCYLYNKTLTQVSGRLRERLEKGNCIIATMLYKPARWVPFFSDELYKIYLFDKTAFQ